MTFAAVAALAVALSVTLLVSSVATPVQAKITPVDTACETKGGGTPPGQQPTCQGEGQEEVVVKERQNPSGHPPPGQNK